MVHSIKVNKKYPVMIVNMDGDVIHRSATLESAERFCKTLQRRFAKSATGGAYLPLSIITPNDDDRKNGVVTIGSAQYSTRWHRMG